MPDTGTQKQKFPTGKSQQDDLKKQTAAHIREFAVMRHERDESSKAPEVMGRAVPQNGLNILQQAISLEKDLLSRTLDNLTSRAYPVTRVVPSSPEENEPIFPKPISPAFESLCEDVEILIRLTKRLDEVISNLDV